MARNTVRKILRFSETEFPHEREDQPLPRIGPCRDELERLLSAKGGKPAREHLTLIRIVEELRAVGF